MSANSVHRQLFDVKLEPVSGSRFQPTGFPDLGAAVFQRPVRQENGDVLLEQSLLVESPQSMANRLEAVGWDEAVCEPVEVLAGLPYVRVVDEDGEFVTSSRVEAHRLASAFVKDSTLDGTSMKEVIRERLDLRDDRPMAGRQIARAVAAMDPLCLLHGVFFAEKASVWPGQPKIARAVTGFVEAHGVYDAVSGGVKRDVVRHSLSEGAGGTAEGYGTVPYHRTEWTAAEIVASFAIDHAQLRSYGLGDEGASLLGALARWEIRTLLDGGLRLRTACDLVPVTDDVRDRADELLPQADVLIDEVRKGVVACHEVLGDGAPIVVVWNGGKK